MSATVTREENGINNWKVLGEIRSEDCGIREVDRYPRPAKKGAERCRLNVVTRQVAGEWVKSQERCAPVEREAVAR